ncbi:MAG: leucine-rich repeat domain-containing protein [Clostridia bacterium]|nr:leucine-rich repeat domain-containing protein [Clostridia bacterium]
MKKKILIFLLTICLAIPGSLCLTACGGDNGTKGLTFMKVGGGYSVKVGTATDAEIVIPATYKNEPVVDIWKEAFKDCTFITSVSIPDSVESIGEAAFDGCTSLKTITIPNTVTNIGHGVVTNCTSLESITTPMYPSMDISYFFRTPSNSGIPESLKVVTITKGTVLSDNAFNSCKNLTDIILPSELTEIGEYAFKDCDSLTRIRIPAGVTNIDAGAFFSCSDLEKVYYDGTIESWCNIEFEKGTLGEYGTSNPMYSADEFYMYEAGTNSAYEVKNIVIPETVTTIGKYQFDGFDNLESIVIPSTVTEICEGAFNLCYDLLNVYYTGTESQWNAIDGHANAERSGRTINYNFVPEA